MASQRHKIQKSQIANDNFSKNLQFKHQHRIINQENKPKPKWDERFVLSKIPQYEYFRDKFNGKQIIPNNNSQQQNQQNIQPNIVFEPGGKIRKIKFEQNVNQNRPMSKYKSKKEIEETKYSNNPLVQHYINMQEKPLVYDLDNNPKIVEGYIQQLQKDINEQWEIKNIPHFHRKCFSESIRGLPNIQIVQNVYKELKQLLKDRSQIQICLKIIQGREHCLETLRQKVDQLKGHSDEEQENLLKQISQTIKDLRILSLEVVEQIVRWRESILQNHYKKNNLQNIQLPFYYNERNYLLKMRDDLKIFKKSNLQYHVNLSINTISDPFLLIMQTQQIINDPQYVDFTQITHDCSHLIQRIRASELIIFEESLQRRVKEQFGDYVVRPVNKSEENIQAFLQNYLAKVSQDIKHSFLFDVEDILRKIKDEQDVSFLKIQSEGEYGEDFQGLAIICVDKSQYQIRRINILHVSCLEKSFYNSIINTLVDFIWKNDNCDDIRVNLFYQQEDNKLQLNKFVKNIFDLIGFKWKQLINDPITNKRATIFCLKRPENIPKKQKKGIQECIEIKSFVVLSEKNGLPLEKKERPINFDVSWNLFKCLQGFYKRESSEKIIQQDNNLTFIQKNLDLGDEDIYYKGCITQNINSNEQLNTFIQQVFPDQNIFLTNEGQTVACIQNNCFRWKNFTHVKHENINYIRIQKNDDLGVNITKCFGQSSDFVPIYFLQTDDSLVDFFIMESNQALIDKIQNQKEDLASYIQKNMQQCDTQQAVEEEIWIQKVEFEQKIINYQQYQNEDIKYCAIQYSFSLNYNPQIEGNLSVETPQKKAIMWNPPFIMGFINKDANNKIDFPLACCLVQK